MAESALSFYTKIQLANLAGDFAKFVANQRTLCTQADWDALGPGGQAEFKGDFNAYKTQTELGYLQGLQAMKTKLQEGRILTGDTPVLTTNERIAWVTEYDKVIADVDVKIAKVGVKETQSRENHLAAAWKWLTQPI